MGRTCRNGQPRPRPDGDHSGGDASSPYDLHNFNDHHNDAAGTTYDCCARNGPAHNHTVDGSIDDNRT